MNYILNKKILFVIIFSIVGFVALQIPIAQLAGSKAAFTLFDFLAPITGAFLGTLPGIFTVLLMQILNFIFHGFQSPDIGVLIRFFPPLLACLYFSKNRKINLLIPIIAIIAFNLHPIGGSVWYYSLYWLIPIICYFFYDRWIIARSLGATFTAQAVGGALWIYAFSLPANVWINLIPIVAIERSIFALGIAVSYLGINNLLSFLMKKAIISRKYEFIVNPNYVWHLK